ncbi:hypothetical protein O9X98_11175 [Agrobacterium salinitolerans]|nr:hypothetical protein [Agrobacterium salinitolerans]
MLGLWKSKKRKAEEEKNDLKAIVTEDLLGGSEWKESKVGYLTGLSSVGKVAGSFATNLSQSAGRLGLLFKLLTRGDDLPSLPDVGAEDYDGKKRFNEAMYLHRRKDRDFQIAMRNTRRSAYLYGVIDLSACVYLAAALIARDYMPLTTLALHVTPIMVFSALTFKAAYFNWVFRHRTLDLPAAFIKSGDWLPRA